MHAMKNILLPTCLLLTLCWHLQAQPPATDSLLQAVDKMPDDTSKINKLNDLVALLQYADPAKAVIVAKQAITQAEKQQYKLGLAVAYRLRGVLLADQTKLDSAKLFYDKAFDIIKKQTDKPALKQQGLLRHNYGVLYHHRQQMDSATLCYFEAAKIYTSIGEEGLLFYPYANLVAIYSFLKDNHKALQYGIACRKAAEILQDPSKLAMAVNNEMAARLELKQYDSVAAPLRTNSARATMAGNKYALAKANHLLGQYFVDGTKQYDSAIFYFNLALQMHTESGNQYEIAGMLHNIGYAYKEAKQYNKAASYLTQSNGLATQLQLDQVVYYNLENLVAVEEARGNTNTAYTYLKQFVDIKDSLNARNNRAQVNDLEKKYQTTLKDNQLQLQQATIRQKNTLNYILTGSAIALLLITILIYRNYRHRQTLQQQRITELETEQKLAATQAVLKGEEQERTRLAKDLHDGLGGMLSGIKFSLNTMKGNLIMTPENAVAFERSIDMLDSSIQEMRRVAHNMMPEALVKFGLDEALKDFCDSINQTGALHVSYQALGMPHKVASQTVAIAIYRIVQELINNTIKHAAAVNAIVQLTHEGNRLWLTVEDDGKGFDQHLLHPPTGIGWRNIQARVAFLKGSTDIQSEKGKGTSVHIEIPII